MPQRRKRVVNTRRDCRVHGADDQAIPLQTSQSQSQHALRDAPDRTADLVEPRGASASAQQLDDQYGPLVANARERFAHQPAFTGIVVDLVDLLCRLIFHTGYPISAFLRIFPLVTILALVTKRNQAT